MQDISIQKTQVKLWCEASECKWTIVKFYAKCAYLLLLTFMPRSIASVTLTNKQFLELLAQESSDVISVYELTPPTTQQSVYRCSKVATSLIIITALMCKIADLHTFVDTILTYKD